MSGAEDEPERTDRLTAAERDQRRRRLARVFGDSGSEQTKDDLDDPAERRSSTNDDWLRRQVPPHHG